MQTVLDSKDLDYAFMFALQQANSIKVEEFKQFFNNLPVDPYIKGNYRFRRLSRFKVSSAGKLIKLPHGYLFQSKHYNPLVGDLKREFAELNDAILELEEFKKLVFAFNDYCKLHTDSREIGVHQIRTTCSQHNYGNPAPEGIHRDGTDLIAIFSVDRENIEGGETHLYKSRKESPVFNKVLNPGEMLLLNDREFFHFSTPIKPKSYECEGTRDVFVLTCPSLLSKY